jgi:hypothetical protein
MEKLPKEVLRAMARMGGEIKAGRYVTVEQHEFIQDDHLDGQGKVAHHEIEEAAGFARTGTLDSFFNELETREKRKGRPARYEWRPKCVRSASACSRCFDAYEARMDEQELAHYQDFVKQEEVQ